MNKKKILFLLSHPIQYHSPLFKEMEKSEKFDLTVLYCSDHGLTENIDPGFGKSFKWDIPLLEGYKYIFLKNYPLKPSIGKFFGLINPGIVKQIYRNKDAAIIVYGWNYFTNLTAIFFGKLFGCKVFFRGDNPLNQELFKSKKLRSLKKILLGKILFRFIDKFLYVGKENKEFYKYYGANDDQLIFAPHAVDNKRFRKFNIENIERKAEIRKKLGLPENDVILLFAGKFIPKKRPLDLLKALKDLNGRISLVMVGDGELKTELKNYITHQKISNVHFPGFKNQTEIPDYILTSDILVLPSETGETWGLIINEAMNFDLPIICSDLCGCSKDLVHNGKNGFIYKTGDVNDLREKLQILINNEKLRKEYGRKSGVIIEKYSYSEIINALESVTSESEIIKNRNFARCIECT